MEITHIIDQRTRRYVQIVSPQRLREILDLEGSNYTPPKDFRPEDEWVVEDQDCRTPR